MEWLVHVARVYFLVAVALFLLGEFLLWLQYGTDATNLAGLWHFTARHPMQMYLAFIAFCAIVIVLAFL